MESASLSTPISAPQFRGFRRASEISIASQVSGMADSYTASNIANSKCFTPSNTSARHHTAVSAPCTEPPCSGSEPRSFCPSVCLSGVCCPFITKPGTISPSPDCVLVSAACYRLPWRSQIMTQGPLPCYACWTVLVIMV